MMTNNVKLIEDESILSLITGGRVIAPPPPSKSASPTIREDIITIIHGVEGILKSIGGLLSGLGGKGASTGPTSFMGG